MRSSLGRVCLRQTLLGLNGLAHLCRPTFGAQGLLLYLRYSKLLLAESKNLPAAFQANDVDKKGKTFRRLIFLIGSRQDPSGQHGNVVSERHQEWCPMCPKPFVDGHAHRPDPLR